MAYEQDINSELKISIPPIQARTLYRDRFFGKFDQHYRDNVWANVNITELFYQEIDFLFSHGRSAYILVYSTVKGSGKSLVGMSLARRFDSHWNVKNRMKSHRADMIHLLLQELKKHDVKESMIKLVDDSKGSEIKMSEIWKSYMDSINKPQDEGGRITLISEERGIQRYYEGIDGNELRKNFVDILYDLQDDELVRLSDNKLNKTTTVGSLPKLHEQSRSTFIIDESSKITGEHSRVLSDRFTNILDILRVLNYDLIQVGLHIPEFASEFDYIIRPHIPIFDKTQQHKVKHVISKLYCKSSVSGGEGTEFIFVGYLLIKSPPEDIIKEYLRLEKTTNVASIISSGGLGGVQSKFDLARSYESMNMSGYNPKVLYDELKASEYWDKITLKRHVYSYLRILHADIEGDDIEKVVALIEAHDQGHIITTPTREQN